MLRHLISNDFIIVRKENHENEDTFEMSAQRNRQLCGLRNSHIVNLLGTLLKDSEVDGKVEEGFVYDAFKLALVYEYIFVDLEKEMDNRLLENRPYEEQELMLIMTRTYQLTKSASTVCTTWRVGESHMPPSVLATSTSVATIK